MGELVRNDTKHYSDHELLAFADGELDSNVAAAVQSHLEACWACRGKLGSLEKGIEKFIQVHQDEFASQIPPAAGPRALLKARLEEMGERTRETAVVACAKQIFSDRAIQLAAAAAVLVVCAALLSSSHSGSDISVNRAASIFPMTGAARPDRKLTPGAVRHISLGEVCSLPVSEKNKDVPDNIRREVLAKYGIKNANPADYEVDYLITPELGGSDDLANLWPEPYQATDWNAYVKDALEDRLHQMVCDGKIDITTAQQAIASDWIGAYKKYFNTQYPLPHDARGTSESFRHAYSLVASVRAPEIFVIPESKKSR